MMIKKVLIGEAELKIAIADNFWRRFLGLMGQKELPSAQGLLITSCNSVHMCFMRFAIDVVYFDEQFVVKKVVHDLRPWLGISMCVGAASALEIGAGEAKRLNINVGDKLTGM